MIARCDPMHGPRSLVIAAFAAIHVFWGSTYPGIRFAIKTIPPFLMTGFRSRERPTPRQWRDAAVGLILRAPKPGAALGAIPPPVPAVKR